MLFNDALNTFYLGFYGIRRMVKDHSDSKGSFICTIPQTGYNIQWPNKACGILYVLFCLWDGAYKRSLAAKQKE